MNLSVHSPDRSIRVRTTEQGLPTAIWLAEHALTKHPDELAREIAAACQVSARRAQFVRRRELTHQGVAPGVIDGLRLSTERQLEEAETAMDTADDGRSDSPLGRWLPS